MVLPDSVIYSDLDLEFPQSGKILPSGHIRPYIVFNMVTTVDGRATPQASTPTDRQVMRQLRAAVDGVLLGGGTLRSDPIALRIPQHLIRKKPPLGIVWSRSGNLPLDHPFWQAGKEQRVAIIAPETPPDRQEALAPLAQVCCVSTITEMLEVLWAKFQVQTLLVEGGPTLNFLLLAQGIGEELFLTLSPLLIAGQNPLTLLSSQTGLQPPIAIKLRSVIAYKSELYLRYQL